MNIVHENTMIRVKAIAHFVPPNSVITKAQLAGQESMPNIHEVMEIDLTMDIDEPQMVFAIISSIKAINGKQVMDWSDVNIEVKGIG